MRFVRNILFLSSLLVASSSAANQAATHEDEVSNLSPRQLQANTKASKGFQRGLTIPTVVAKDMFSSIVKKQKKRSGIPSTSSLSLVRHLIKNNKGGMSNLSFIAKPILRKAQQSYLGMFGFMAESDWEEEYQETIDAIVELFLGMLAQTDFQLDNLVSPSDYCNSGYETSESEVCEETVSAFVTLASNLAYHPWAVQDIMDFIITNIFMLPLEYILDWENLREFLHDIPKEFLYENFVYDFVYMILDIFDSTFADSLPTFIETFYQSFEGSGLLDDGSEDFVSLLSSAFEFDLKEDIDYLQDEMCYVTNLKHVWMDFEFACVGHEETEWKVTRVTNIPFCMDPGFIEEVAQEELFYFEGGNSDMHCEMIAHISKGEVIVENPNDKFIMFEEEEPVKQKCKWLRKQPFDVRVGACTISPEVSPKVALFVCPSSCCVFREEPSNMFLKKVDVIEGVEVPTMAKCKWLSKKSEKVKKRYCKKDHTYFTPEFTLSPAYVMCPETCGLC